MQNLFVWIYVSVCALVVSMSGFVSGEVRRIKNDERGMELLQVLLIILMVVVIGALVWAFLGDVIAGLFDDILQNLGRIGN